MKFGNKTGIALLYGCGELLQENMFFMHWFFRLLACLLQTSGKENTCVQKLISIFNIFTHVISLLFLSTRAQINVYMYSI